MKETTRRCNHNHPDAILIGDYEDDGGYFIRLCSCIHCGIYGFRQKVEKYHPTVIEDFGKLRTTKEIRLIRQSKSSGKSR